MRLARQLYLAASLIPTVLLIVANYMPPGTDPREFGLGTTVGMISLGVSLFLGVLGCALLAIGRKAQQFRWVTVIVTLFASWPFLYLVVVIAMGKA